MHRAISKQYGDVAPLGARAGAAVLLTEVVLRVLAIYPLLELDSIHNQVLSCLVDKLDKIVSNGIAYCAQ
jgi:hypothetical protein